MTLHLHTMQNKFYKEFESQYDNNLKNPDFPFTNGQICMTVEGHREVMLSLIELVNNDIIKKLEEEIRSLDKKLEQGSISAVNHILMVGTILHCIDKIEG
jgi:hypothetical protein